MNQSISRFKDCQIQTAMTTPKPICCISAAYSSATNVGLAVHTIDIHQFQQQWLTDTEVMKARLFTSQGVIDAMNELLHVDKVRRSYLCTWK